jgi:subtilisin family serine protease
MRSKSPDKLPASNANWSIERVASRACLPVGLIALAMLLSLGTSADAAWLGGRGFGGAGPTGFFGGRITSHPIGMVDPVGKIGKVGKVGPSISGRHNDGGRTSGGGDDRPRKPRIPKIPIIVGVPTVVTGVASVTSGAASSQLAPSGGHQSSSGRQVGRIGDGLPPADERRYVPDEVLIQMSSTVTDGTIDAIARRLRLNRVESFTSSGVTMFRWKIPDRRSVPAVIRQLQAERIVLAAQPNYLYQVQDQRTQDQRAAADRPQTSDTEGDPGQYALAKLHLPQAHMLAKGEKVLIAVIDSGVDAEHPELSGMIAESFDAIGSGEKAHTHGTAVAGAIVAHARLMGAAPQARILAVQAFGAKDRTAEATTYSISKGMDWAMSRGARIINMSFSGPRDPSVAQRMMQARQQGLVLIAAAGNAGPKSAPLYPAAYPNVIAVTATDADDKLFADANQGRHIAVAAPGVDILLPAPDASYQVTTGTSFAAAEVSGIVALMLERKPDLDHDGVRKVLTATARQLGPKGSEKGSDPQFGAGLVDAYAAIRCLEGVPAATAARAVPATTGTGEGLGLFH